MKSLLSLSMGALTAALMTSTVFAADLRILTAVTGGKDPAERNGRIRGVYPWGYEWPPPKGIDNFADSAGANRNGLEHVIPDYDDKFPSLAAITALPASNKGFVGLAGNVSEWVDSDYELGQADNTATVIAAKKQPEAASTNPCQIALENRSDSQT
jgi:hypothetical protein